MSYLDSLKEIQDSVTRTSDFNYGQKVIMLEIIAREISKEELPESPFERFFSDVIKQEIGFDFKKYLAASSYKAASEEANACLNILARFSDMKPTTTMLAWLIHAFKYTDELVLYYIQEILGETVPRNSDHGKERARYIYINKRGYKAQKAGMILDNLYDKRNNMEHRSKKHETDPKKEVLTLPNYGKILKKLQLDFPKALIAIRDTYVHHCS